MKELFLLGAGASVEAGVPDTYKMANQMLSKFIENGNNNYAQYAKILKFVIGGLLFQQGINGENPFNGVNIEDLFNTVLLLSERHDSELSPFIGAWHPRIVDFESGDLRSFQSQELLNTINEPIEKYIKKKIDEFAREIKYHQSAFVHVDQIETFFNSVKFERQFIDAVRQVLLGGEGILFRRTADVMMQELVKMVWITDEEKVDYLTPLISLVKNQTPIIVTLNYDNSIELVGQHNRIYVDTGFDAWSESGEFTFVKGKIPLIKLHGSIDWALYAGDIDDDKPLPYQMIKRVELNPDELKDHKPAVIFGGKNKLTAKGPFLSLLRTFEKELMTLLQKPEL